MEKNIPKIQPRSLNLHLKNNKDEMLLNLLIIILLTKKNVI